MLNKILKRISVLPLISLSACTTYKGTPRAINKPEKLFSNRDLYETTNTSSTHKRINENHSSVIQTKDASLLNLSKYINNRPDYSSSVDSENYFKEPEKNIISVNKAKVDGILRIALLLPGNSVKNKQVARDLENAAQMAIFDGKSRNTILQIYNTDGTKNDAKKQAMIAIEEDADIIVGPLFADEVEGIKSVVKDIPVISFTTNTDVLSKNVFSIGFLIEQQIKRVVEYSVQNNKTKFGIITSDTESGRFIYDIFKKYVYINNGEITESIRYSSNASKNQKLLLSYIKKLAQFDDRKREYNNLKQELSEKIDEFTKLSEKNNNDSDTLLEQVASFKTQLEQLEKQITVTPPSYDSVFIFADDINDLIMIGSSLMYYDVNPNKVQYIGTSQLENMKVYAERAFHGAWYPSVSTKYNSKFISSYKKYFNKEPIKIASLAYDAIALVNSIGSEIGYIDVNDLMNPNGWTGINGTFRFVSDGISERNMDVKEVIGKGAIKSKIISPAQTNFIQTN